MIDWNGSNYECFPMCSFGSQRVIVMGSFFILFRIISRFVDFFIRRGSCPTGLAHVIDKEKKCIR